MAVALSAVFPPTIICATSAVFGTSTARRQHMTLIENRLLLNVNDNPAKGSEYCQLQNTRSQFLRRFRHVM
jgi:hypothetical protein